MENYHNFDKINNKKSLKIRDFVDFNWSLNFSYTRKIILPRLIKSTKLIITVFDFISIEL